MILCVFFFSSKKNRNKKVNNYINGLCLFGCKISFLIYI
jgi:uncharacterized protein YutD